MKFIDLQELPTLAEVEDFCLRQKPHRAPGPHSLVCLLKYVALGHQRNPMAFSISSSKISRKGQNLPLQGRFPSGHLETESNTLHPEACRGNLSADSYGKILHANLTSRSSPLTTGWLSQPLAYEFNLSLGSMIRPFPWLVSIPMRLKL